MTYASNFLLLSIELKMAKYFFSFFFFLALINNTYGQDIHWSQFNDNQLFQNPGNAGHFDGDYRFIGNYRDQWRSVTVPFSTFSLSADAHIKNLGLGLQLFNDQAGDGKFRTTEVHAAFSYLIKFKKDAQHMFRPGITIGMNQRQVDWNAFSFDSQYNGYVFNPSAPSNENFQNSRKTNPTIGLGLIHEWRKNERFKISSGLGLFNINQANQGFYDEIVKRDQRWNLFSKITIPVANKWDIIPSISYTQQGIYRELNFGANAKYYLGNSNIHQALYFGVWNRSKDASFVSLGYDYSNLFIGVSYDINYSQLVPASNLRGGVEISIRYIIHRFKPKQILHRVCPDFI